jgi:exosortase/archaeosortase family protein
MQQVRTLNVAEACAGLRSLMTFISIAAAVAFLSSRPLWQKFVITLSAVPIAISCNVARVTGQGLLDHYVSQEMSDGFAHQFVGLAMLIPAFFLILVVGWLLDKMFVEEVDEGDRPVQQKRAAKRVGKGYRTVAPATVGAGSTGMTGGRVNE